MVRLCTFLFFGISLNASGQDELDSLTTRLSGASDSIRVELYLALANHHKLVTREYDSAIYYAEEAVELADGLHLLTLKCAALESNGNTLARVRNYDEAVPLLETAVQVCAACANQTVLASVYNALGYVYDRLDQHDAAIDYFLKSARQYESIGDMDGTAKAYMNTVSIFGQQEQTDKVKEYTGKVLTMLGQVVDDQIKANIYTASASQYAEIGVMEPAYLDSALSIADEGLAVARTNGFHTNVAQLFSVKSAIYFLRKDFGACISYCDSIFQYEDFAPAETLIQANLRYADGYAGLGQSEKGISYLDSAVILNEELGSGYYRMIIAESRYEAFKNTGQLRQALEALEQLRLAEDSLLALEKHEAINDLEKKYETEKKELQIANLTQQNEIQELQGRQQMLYFSVGIALLILLVLGIYFYYKQRLSKQREQTAIHRQQLLRSQINPHFIFNALASIRGFLFEEKNVKEAIRYLGKFARLMRTVLDLSAKEWVTLAEEIKALELYLEIQQLRFDQKFEFEVDIQPELDQNEIFVPPLLAQPFIENAIEHGFRGVEGGGKVIIKCLIEDDKLVFRIQDNGIGVDHMQVPKDHESRAIQIFRDRMELLGRQLKMKLSFDVSDLGAQGGKGTLVAYQLPLLKEVY
ncbi:MAG: histidine kinase [Imperialibacter sp.]|uniref:histidine kinase n=1 Tax=Imperialibacter sp. TaxID=2038411 RepID=UPI0032EDB549